MEADLDRAGASTASGLSLRARLTLWMLLIFVVLQFTSALVVLLYHQASFSRLSDARIRSRFELIAADLGAVGFRVTDDDLARIAADRLRFSMPEASVISVYDRDGRLEASSRRPGLDAERFGVARAMVGAPVIARAALPGLDDRSEGGGAATRVLVERLSSPDGREHVVLVAVTEHFFESLVGIAVRVLALTVLAGAVAAAVAGWIISGLAIAPLNQLRRIAGSLAPERLDQPIELMGASREAAGIDRELLDVRAKLLQALRAQDRFISNVSHELKTPITVLLTEAQTLDPAGLSPDARAFARSVTEEMQRLGRMVESFLMLTRVRGGKTLVQADLLDLNEVAMSAVESSARMSQQHGVPLNPELATTDTPPRICGDAELIRVMIVNLIRNAVRFSPRGRAVHVRVAQVNRECEVSVRDHGPGVPADLIEAVFDRFVQASEEAAQGRGHGLGLSISQGIAELHGGRIRASNLASGGCEFVVRIPAADQVGTDGTGSDPGADQALSIAPGRSSRDGTPPQD